MTEITNNTQTHRISHTRTQLSITLFLLMFLTGCTSHIRHSQKDPNFNEKINTVIVNAYTKKSFPIRIKRHNGGQVSQKDKDEARDGINRIITLFGMHAQTMLTTELKKNGVQILDKGTQNTLELRFHPNSGEAVCVGFSCSSSLNIYIGLFKPEKRQPVWSARINLSMPYEMMDDPDVMQNLVDKVVSQMSKDGLFFE